MTVKQEQCLLAYLGYDPGPIDGLDGSNTRDAVKAFQRADGLTVDGVVGVQPSGAHDAYNRGDKVSYNGKHYICTADANVYAPDVYGWKET